MTDPHRRGRERGSAPIIGLVFVGVVLLGAALLWMLRAEAATARAELELASARAAHAEARLAIADEERVPTPSRIEPLSDDQARPLAAVPAAASASASPAADEALGIVVYGAVLDDTGNGVHADSTWVRFDGPEGASAAIPLVDGAYSLAGLSPGTWTLTLDVADFRPYEHTVTLSEERLLERHDIVLERATVLCVRLITPDGAPLLDALPADAYETVSVVATAERLDGDLPPIAHRAYTRHALGKYTAQRDTFFLPVDVPQGCTGSLEVSVSPPFWTALLLRHVVVESQLVEEGTDDLLFVVDPARVAGLLGTLEVEIVDAATGEPIAGAFVALSDAQSSGVRRTTDEQGRFSFEHAWPGRLEFEVRAEGYERVLQHVDLAPAERKQMRIGLSAATTISGVVIDGRDGGDDDGGLRLCAVSLDRFDDDWSLHWRLGAVGADDEGRFEITSVGRGTYYVFAYSRGIRGRPVLVDTRGGDVGGVELTVETAHEVELTPAWSDTERRAVRVTTEDGTPIAFFRSWTGGNAWTMRLEPGRYRFEIEGRAEPASITVGEARAAHTLPR